MGLADEALNGRRVQCNGPDVAGVGHRDRGKAEGPALAFASRNRQGGAQVAVKAGHVRVAAAGVLRVIGRQGLSFEADAVLDRLSAAGVADGERRRTLFTREADAKIDVILVNRDRQDDSRNVGSRLEGQGHQANAAKNYQQPQGAENSVWFECVVPHRVGVSVPVWSGCPAGGWGSVPWSAGWSVPVSAG